MPIFHAFNVSRENFHQIFLNFNILLRFSRTDLRTCTLLDSYGIKVNKLHDSELLNVLQSENLMHSASELLFAHKID